MDHPQIALILPFSPFYRSLRVTACAHFNIMAVHSFKHTTELYGRAAVRENRNAWEDSIRKSPEM